MANGDLPTLQPKRRGNQVGPSDTESDEAGFFESTLSAATREMVGLDPQQDVRQFRAENPTAGFASNVLGEGIALTLPFSRVGRAATKALPVFGRGIRTGERLISEGKPVLGRVSEDIASMSAFQTGLIGTSEAVGGDTSEVVEKAAFELALTGAGSAIATHLARSLPMPDRRTSFELQVQKNLDPGYKLDAAPQVKMQRMLDLTDQVEDEGIRNELFRHIAEFSSDVRVQDAPARRSAVSKLVNRQDDGERSVSKKVARMFDVRDSKHDTVKKLSTRAEKGAFDESKEVKGAAQTIEEVENQAKLPTGWEKHAFLPRYNRINTKDGARIFERTLNQVAHPVNAGGRKTWVAREADNGAYVMFRRLREGEDASVQQGDEFVAMKTDDPEFFGPELGEFNKIIDRNVFDLEVAKSAGGSESLIGQQVDEIEQSMPDTGVLSGEMKRGTKGEDIARGVTEAIIGKERAGELRQALGSTTDWIGRVTREFASPSLQRYGGKNGSARAAGISMMSRAIHDRARMEATQMLSGELPASYKNSVWKHIFKMKSPREGGLLQMVDDLEDRDLRDISAAFRQNMSPDEMSRRGMRENATNFMARLNEADQKIIDEFNRTMRDVGLDEFDGIKNHYMLSRMWEGRFRVPIKKQDGTTIAVASGKRSKDALDEAERLKKVINDEGTHGRVSFQKNDLRIADQGDDLDDITGMFDDRLAQQNVDWMKQARDPDRFEERAGVRGFVGERADFGHKDLREILGKQVREMYDLMARRTVDNRLWDARTRLANEDPDFSRMLENELKARFGERGRWTEATENAVDRVLTPAFGVRASEVTRAVNNGIYQLTLGMGNVGFAALNAATFLQTALPEVSFLMKTPPDRLARFYGLNLVNTPGGVREVRSLEPLKIMREAFNDMSKPPDDLWEVLKRAQDEGKVSPVLEQEIMGPNADMARHFKSFFKEHRTLPETIQEVSSYMPARTEELSRSMALSMGWRLGKDFMGLEGENLYQFATRFVDNTHFRYSAADRPQVMRGAFGGLAGLFKNWMIHYIGNMTRYSGEAFRNGNFGPLLWSQAGTLGLAGLSGSAAMPMAEGLNSLMSDEPLVQNLYQEFGYADAKDGQFLGSPADAIYFGLPAFLNLGLSQRAAVPGSDVPNDIKQLFTIMHWDRAVALGDIIGSSTDAFFATGEHPARSQQVMDAMYRAFLPRTAQNIMKNIGQRGTRSLKTQNTILSEQTWSETTINTLGFTPNRLARTYEMMDILFERRKERQEAVSAFGEMLTQARQENDPQAVQNIYMRATHMGIDPDSIAKSADSQLNKRQEGIIERQFDDARNLALRRALGD